MAVARHDRDSPDNYRLRLNISSRLGLAGRVGDLHARRTVYVGGGLRPSM